MLKFRHLLTALIIVITLSNCKESLDKKIEFPFKTKSGFPYRIEKGPSNIKPQKYGYIKYCYEVRTSFNDSVLTTNYHTIPSYEYYDTIAFNSFDIKDDPYDIFKIIPHLNIGDVAYSEIAIDSLKKNGRIDNFNDTYYRKGSMIRLKIEILSSFSQSNAASEDQENELKKNSIENYIKKKNLNVVELSNGVFIQVTNLGDSLNKIVDGSEVSFRYRGQFQDGRIFDSNMEDNKPILKITLGKKHLIPGLEEGLHHFNKGSKGIIFVPYQKGYGNHYSGSIPPYSNLIFDIEIIDVASS